MKTYVGDSNRSNSYKRILYISLALFVIFMVAGCSSTTPITQTYTEYIPPIKAPQKECLKKISGELKRCQGQIELEQKECTGKALITAQEKLAHAQVDHQQHLAALEAQRVKESENQNLQFLNQQKEYADCQARNKLQEAIQRRNNAAGGTGQPITMLYIDTCTNPQPNGNYQAGVGGYAINPPEPQIEDFLQDAQCYANTKCEGDYNHQYETCGGKVLITTRCFANCAGDEK